MACLEHPAATKVSCWRHPTHRSLVTMSWRQAYQVTFPCLNLSVLSAEQSPQRVLKDDQPAAAAWWSCEHWPAWRPLLSAPEWPLNGHSECSQRSLSRTTPVPGWRHRCAAVASGHLAFGCRESPPPPTNRICIILWSDGLQLYLPPCPTPFYRCRKLQSLE